MDSTFPVGNVAFPGAGTMIVPLINSTGKNPIVVGKPKTWMLDHLIKTHNLDRKRTVMVGDRLDTDILFGIEGKLNTLLVLTGIATIHDLQSNQNSIHPNFVSHSLGDIAKLYPL